MEKKNIPGTYYSITIDGQLINEKRNKKLKPLFNKRTGYMHYQYRKDKQLQWSYVHRLVYEMFVGYIPEGKEIDHIDNDRQNNHLNNLRCITIKENRAIDNKKNTKRIYKKEYRKFKSRLYSVYSWDLKYLGKMTSREIKKKFNLSESILSKIRLRKKKKNIRYLDKNTNEYVVFSQIIGKEVLRTSDVKEFKKHQRIKTLPQLDKHTLFYPFVYPSDDYKEEKYYYKKYDKNYVPDYLVKK